MKIGILSDTHGDERRTRQAALAFVLHGVECVIHCGDIGSEAVLVELAEHLGGAHIPVHAVFGNMDRSYAELLQQFPGGTGLHLAGRAAELVLDGKSVGVLHGDDADLLEEWVGSGRYDYIFCGHTHQARDEQVGRTRLINPGALHRVFVPTVAILDTRSNEVSFIRLAGPSGG